MVARICRLRADSDGGAHMPLLEDRNSTKSPMASIAAVIQQLSFSVHGEHDAINVRLLEPEKHPELWDIDDGQTTTPEDVSPYMIETD